MWHWLAPPSRLVIEILLPIFWIDKLKEDVIVLTKEIVESNDSMFGF